MSNLSKLTKVSSPWLPPEVSIYIKLVPIGGKEIAPALLVGELVFEDLKKFCILSLLFISLHIINHFCNK